MLQYFRFNDPYRLLGLLAVMLFTYLAFFVDLPPLTYPELKSFLIGKKVEEGYSLYKELVDSVAPLTGWFYGLVTILFGESLLARHIVSFFIIFIQATYLGFIFTDKKVYPENTLVPSLLYALLFVFSFDTLALTGELIGLTFLLIALNSLFKEIEFREQRNETVLSLGFFIGISSLFEFSYSVYLIASLIILVIYTRSSPRKFFLTIVGFLLPHGLLLSIFYVRSEVTPLVQYFYLPNIQFLSEKYVGFGSMWLLMAMPASFTVISLLMINRVSGFTKYQSQLLQAMFFWMIFSFLQILYSKNFRPQSFIALIPSFSFFISHFLLSVRRKKLAEVCLWILLVGVIAISYAARYARLPDVNYTNLIVNKTTPGVTGKKVVVLADDLGVYTQNTLSTPFLNWRLSREIFEQPDYYENVIAVYTGFKADPPDIILDPEKVMRPFFERIPELKKKYRATKDGYQKINN